MKTVLVKWNQERICEVTGNRYLDIETALCKDIEVAKMFSQEITMELPGVSDFRFYSLTEIN